MKYLAAMLLCLLSFSAQARPSPYPVTSFDGDKYSARQAQMATDVARAAKAKQGAKARKAAPTRRHTSPRAKQRRWIAPIPAPRPIAEPGTVEPMSWGGFDRVEAPATDGRREASRVIGGKPQGCPPRWCGCWLARLLGMNNRNLWLARNWASVGSHIGRPVAGAIVVWRHHVGKITAVSGNRIRVLSGNDRRAVRDRWRTTNGVIAYRSSS